MIRELFARIFEGKAECHRKLDEAIDRSERARARAQDVCERVEAGCDRRTSVDWMRQAEIVATASRETGIEHSLPIAVDGVLAPSPEEARARERRIVYPDEP